MKKMMCAMMFVVIFITMNSCSADSAEGSNSTTTEALVTNYSYNDSEIETMKLINDYRLSVGLNALEKINHISFKCE
jgi:hypothetical protein